MSTHEIVAALDAEIARLQLARALLRGASAKRRGRPPASLAAVSNGTAPKKRTLSAAGRARIAAAQRSRWAKQKAATKKK